MNWSEHAFVLSSRPLGERDAVVSVLTRTHGRYAGLVRGGAGQRQKAVWQPGRLVDASWRARLSEHLGSLMGETIRDYAAGVLDNPLALALLLSASSLVDACVPERMPIPGLFEAFSELLPLEESIEDLSRYVQFECVMLHALGYGLDLDSCALTGTTQNLAYVSPKTGRAVCAEAAAPWAARLFPLPSFLGMQPVEASWDDVCDGLHLTGYFLESRVFPTLNAFTLGMLLARRNRVAELVHRRRSEARTAKARAAFIG